MPVKTKRVKVKNFSLKKKITYYQKVEKRVKKGIAFLDRKFGRKEWLERINMRIFDISDPYTCVIGQVYKTAFGFSKNFSPRLGFEAYPDRDGNMQKDYDTLQYIWSKKIRAMKKVK